jgi:hypothetical protein
LRYCWVNEPTRRQAQSEKAPSPKKRRARKSKASSDIPNSHISDTQNLVKGGKPKRPATKRKAAGVAVGAALQQRVPKKNILGDISSNLFSATNEEDEEFRLAVEDMGKKRQLSIFKDAVEDSPGKAMFLIVSSIETNRHTGRTESPLEDHRYVSHRLKSVKEGFVVTNLH